MMKCSECGKEYTDNDMAMDEADVPIKPACKYCVGWSENAYGHAGQRKCRDIDQGRPEGFTNEGCSNDNIYCTGPDFFCAMFKFKRK